MNELDNVDINEIMMEMTDDGHFVYDKVRTIICLIDEFGLSPDDSMKLCSVIEDFDFKYHNEVIYDEDDFIAKFDSHSGRTCFLHRGNIVVRSFFIAPLDYVAKTGKLHKIAKLSNELEFLSINVDTPIWIKIREYVGYRHHGIIVETRDDYEDYLWTYDECRFNKIKSII